MRKSGSFPPWEGGIEGGKLMLLPQERNPLIEEGLTVDFAELDVQFWHKPGMPR